VTADFAGQTALVTGGTTGIGRAVAGQLAAGGAHAIISGRDPGRGRAARAAVAECGGAVDFVAADLAEVDDVQRLAERALELGQGCIDVMVNNAALYPHLATADRGFFSAENEREAEARGVEKVALPARGPLSKTRAARQKERWFRRAMRWRAGCEATISTLKHPFSMARATYKGERGFQRYVGWSVITKNLCAIARWQTSRPLTRRRRAADG